MGSEDNSEGISRVLFGRTRTAVLSLLYGHPDESFYLRQLVRATGSGNGATQREVKQLSAAGLIVRKNIGPQTHYQANRHSPIFAELRKLLLKTAGARELLREALAPIRDSIHVAFVYGSIATQTDRPESDMDLMIIGTADFDDVVSRLASAQAQLRREINPSIYPAKEWRTKLAAGNHFLNDVAKAPKLFIIGSENELRELSPKRLAQRPSNQPGRNQKPSRRRGH
jgi:predicted nucleotidyltransferase